MFQKITDHVYVRPHEDYTDRPNIGLIVGEKYSLLYDAGNSEANVIKLKQELADCGLKTPDFVALSHWHWDHTFGMHAWGVPTIAGKDTNDKLKELVEWKWDDISMENRVKTREDILFANEMIKREYPDRNVIVTPADIVFEKRLSIDLGGVICELILAKGPHSEDSVILYVPSDKFVFLGDSNGKDLYGIPWEFDLEHEDEVVEIFMSLPYDKERVRAYIEILDSLDFTKCIGGHAEIMTKEELYNSLVV